MKRIELEESQNKYCDYLTANGVRVLAASVYVELKGKMVVAHCGNEEMLREMACIIEARQLGHELVEIS